MDNFSCSPDHIFVWAGTPGEMPVGWPCVCGVTYWSPEGPEALSSALTASQQRVKELEQERDNLKAAWNTSAAAHWMHRAGDAEQRLRAWPLALAQHWLDGITCDEEQGRDNPRCSCAEEFLGWYPSVGDAVKGWVDHVERSLPAYASTIADLQQRLEVAERHGIDADRQLAAYHLQRTMKS